MRDRTLSSTTQKESQDSCTHVHGDSDMWLCLCKAWNKKEGWMKSTKAMEIPGVGCVVQVTTQQKNLDGSYSLAEALTFVPGVAVHPGDMKEGKGPFLFVHPDDRT